MLDRTVFLREMAVLAELFNRPALSEVLIGRYFEFLSTRLTTEEFEAAARRIFEEERFWPAPVTFVLAVKGDPKAEGEAAWNALVAAASRGDAGAVTPAMLAGLRRIGVTFRDVETASEYRLGEIGKRFRADFEHDSTTDRTALPSDPLRLAS